MNDSIGENIAIDQHRNSGASSSGSSFSHVFLLRRAPVSGLSEVEFKWNTALRADEYIFQLSRTDAFEDASLVISEQTILAPDTTFTLASKWHAGCRRPIIIWRIKAKNNTDGEILETAWSDTLRFRTLPLPPVPVELLSPPDDTTFAVASVPEFKWSSSEGADSYTFQLSEKETFDPLTLFSTRQDTTFTLPKEIRIAPRKNLLLACARANPMQEEIRLGRTPYAFNTHPPCIPMRYNCFRL